MCECSCVRCGGGCLCSCDDLKQRIAELEAKAKELDAIKSEPVPEWEPNFAGMLDKYKELIHPYGYKCSPARQQLIDYVTGLEAAAARYDYCVANPGNARGLFKDLDNKCCTADDVAAWIDDQR